MREGSRRCLGSLSEHGPDLTRALGKFPKRSSWALSGATYKDGGTAPWECTGQGGRHPVHRIPPGLHCTDTPQEGTASDTTQNAVWTCPLELYRACWGP